MESFINDPQWGWKHTEAVEVAVRESAAADVPEDTVTLSYKIVPDKAEVLLKHHRYFIVRTISQYIFRGNKFYEILQHPLILKEYYTKYYNCRNLYPQFILMSKGPPKMNKQSLISDRTIYKLIKLKLS